MREVWLWLCVIITLIYTLLTIRIVYCVGLSCRLSNESSLKLILQLILALFWPLTLLYWVLESTWQEIKEFFHE